MKQRLRQLKRELQEQATARQQTLAATRVHIEHIENIDDKQLFTQAMQGVTALVHTPRATLPRTPPSPHQRVHAALEHALAQNVVDNMSDYWPWDELENGESLLYTRPGLALERLRKLRRGRMEIEAQLDLHGHNTDSARQAVLAFLLGCMARKQRCVRIIHGKGLSSPDGAPVLKLKLKNWLAQRPEVLAFSQAPANAGGAGAVLVLLRRN